jgi:endonuclease YncB( thermonuclease family)
MTYYASGPRSLRRGLPGLLALAITAALFAMGREAVRAWRAETLTGRVAVIDGDSLRLDGQEIRLEGIDAPEYRQTCWRGDREEPCGKQARSALVQLIGAGALVCVSHGSDRYGRKLAVCRVGDVDINRAMVLAGQAMSYGGYETEEAEAHRAGRGVWGSRFERPADWRARHPRP